MKLFIKDRFTINALLGKITKTGSFLEMMNLAAITKLTEITPDDQVKCDIKETEEGNLHWNAKNDTGIEVLFTNPQTEIIKKGIYSLKELEITLDEAQTYLKFIDLNDI